MSSIDLARNAEQRANANLSRAQDAEAKLAQIAEALGVTTGAHVPSHDEVVKHARDTYGRATTGGQRIRDAVAEKQKQLDKAEQRAETHLARAKQAEHILRELGYNPDCAGDCCDPGNCTCRRNIPRTPVAADPVQTVLCHPNTPEGRAQINQITNVMQRTERAWNANTGDEELDRDYLQTLAEPVLNTLRDEAPDLTTHSDHDAWIAQGAEG